MALSVGRGVPEAVRLALLRGRGWVSGKWVEAASKKTFPVLNPANGEVIAEVSSQIHKKQTSSLSLSLAWLGP